MVLPWWRRAPHLSLVNEKLKLVAQGKLRRLMVMCPPRHGKSQLISACCPAWYLGKYPDRRIILCSYEADFAATWGRRARDLLEIYGPREFRCQVSQRSSARNRWDLEGREGGMVSAGVGGAITGRGAHLLVIDDPVKNEKEAASETIRNATWDWYLSTAYTRLEPGGAAVLIMTRWHEDDLAGRLLAGEHEEDREHWEVLSFPALAEEEDLLGREPGEPLWPERYDLEQLERIKRTLGGYFFSALYQQRPGPKGGGLFQRDKFKYFDMVSHRVDDAEYGHYRLHDATWKEVRVKDCLHFQTVDLAASTKDSADYFVAATWAYTPQSELLLLNVYRDRLEGPDQPDALRREYFRQSPAPAYIGIEHTAFQLTMLQTALRSGLPARELKAEGDKYSRALSIAARYESGMVYHRAGAPWLADYEAELLAFPNGKHDDQVDVAAYAAITMAMTAPYVDYNRLTSSSYRPHSAGIRSREF